MFNWNYTTLIRNYSLITDTWAALWGQMIANRRSFKAVFLTIEKDDHKQPPTNHVHLAIATSKPIEPDQLSDKITKAINLKKKHIGSIESIRGKEETLRYISKHIRHSLCLGGEFTYNKLANLVGESRGIVGSAKLKLIMTEK